MDCMTAADFAAPSAPRPALEGVDVVCNVTKTSKKLASTVVSEVAGQAKDKHPHLDGKPPAACGHPDTGLAGNADCASQAAAAQCQTPASPMHQALRDPDPAPSSTQSAQPPCAPGAAGGSAGACCCGDGEDASDSADNPIVLGTSLFFARVPPTVSYESIMELFAQFGTVLTLNLFRPWATAKTSKGCGIIVFEHITAALAAMEALHNKYHWTGGETTMVLEWADPSRQRRENPNTKGVFEAKHKSQGMSGHKGQFRYRSQMRRAVAVSLQQAAAAAGAQQHPSQSHTLHHILPTSNGSTGVSRAAPMAIRGISAMLPQMPGGMPGASIGAWGLSTQDLHNDAAQQAALMTTLATAAPLSHGAASAAALNTAAYSAAAGNLVLPGATQGLGAQATGLAVAGAVPGAAPSFGATFSPGSWGAYVDAVGMASLATNSACGVEPGSPAFAAAAAAAAAGNLPVLGSVLTPAMLQQGCGASRLGPAGLAAGPLDCCSSGTPSCMQPQVAPNTLLQQAPVSYLAARAGLMADAHMLAAAAAAIAHSTGSPVLGAGLQDCHTPLAGSSQTCAFASDSCSSSSYMGSAAHLMPQPRQWLNLQQQQHFAGSTGSLPALATGASVHGGAASYSLGANVVTLPAEPALCNTPTCLQQGLAGATAPSAASWCGGNDAGVGKTVGWW